MIRQKEITSENLKELLTLEVKCFQHCTLNERFLCFNIPNNCPICAVPFEMSYVQFRVPPFILPSPFTAKNFIPKYSRNYFSFFSIRNLSI